ncbi:MAG: tetratricopeptide repeat protein [Polyangiaceae bacterium]
MTPNIIDVTAATFDDAVLHGSQTVPIVVDFWAPWCAPCRTLAPVLEKLAAEYDGKFVLAKVNSEENKALTARFGVRGIPNVKAFVDGRLVDEFSGALPEPAVRDFIERLLPNPGEELRRAAMRDYAVGDATSALSKLDRVAELDPANRLAAVDRAEVLIALGRLEAARTALDGVDVLTRQEDRVKGLVARLNIAAGVEGAPDAATLEARIAADGNDLDARLLLANLHAASQRYEPALSELLEVTTRDRRFRDDAGRKQMVALFSIVGEENELVARYRRLLASVLN